MSNKRPTPPSSPDIQGTQKRDRFRPDPTIQTGKGSRIDHMPSRHARDVITGADPVSRAMGHFGKQSPYKIGA
jgi:hypothetical protein